MPKSRFSLILRGMRGQAARDKYLQHLQGLASQGDNIGTKGNRPASIELFITPFALPLGTTTQVKVSALQPSWDLFKAGSEVTTRVRSVLPGTDTPIKLSRYSAPRVVRRQTTGTTGTAKTSKLSGLKYLKYNTESASIPFGKKTGDTGAFDAYQEIVTQNKASATNTKYSFLDENV